MKKTLLILSLLAFISGCAGKEPPFDAVAVFKKAEEDMRKEAFDTARKGYQDIQEKSPDKSYDAVLMLRIADTYYGEEKYGEAQVEYRAFLNYHPVNKEAAYAQYQVALCSYNELTTVDRDPAPAHAVIKELRTLLDKYPQSGYEELARKYVSICTDWIAEYELYVARFYHKKGAYRAAASRCEKLLADYPGSSSEKDALFYAGLSYSELGERDLARARFETLAIKYPAMKEEAASLLKKAQAP